MIGHEALGMDYFQEHKGNFWLLEETRPFMRALQSLALACWEIDDTETAILHFETLLGLNDEDTQGARYALLALQLQQQNGDAVAALLDAFPGEAAVLWLYGKVLFALQRTGPEGEARFLLAAAQRQNPIVPFYLTGEREPAEVPASDADEEAVACAFTLSQAWEATPGAIDWLKRATGSAPKPAAKERRSGPRSID
jgi:hypothetical protein